MLRRSALLSFIFLSLVLADCGGGGGAPGSVVNYAPTPQPGGSFSPQTVTVSISIPTATQGKKPQYLSPNTQSLTLQLVAVNGTAVPSQAATTINTYPGAQNCNDLR